MVLKDSGSYIIILYVKKAIIVDVGKIGRIDFKKGYYLYVGSAKTNLAKRIERHKRRRKRLFWHVDYLRKEADFFAALPILSSVPLECHIAKRLKGIADWTIDRFGSSDCSCETHLFGMHEDPLKSSAFIDALLYYGIDQFEEHLKIREEG
ncbi:MAG: GIY-YIG nuclease family protein [Nitrospirae bacterium]|nr:GIY-YIG nuclease family protein [Nitrospirota bacterium]